MKNFYLTRLNLFGYDVALASLKFQFKLTWSQAIRLASDYGGGGMD